MKVEAYRCDYCGQIRELDEMTGVIPIEDMFDRMASYPICNCEKTNVHFCTTCYGKVVLQKARLIDRKKDEHGYAAKLKELQYLLRESCVRNIINRKKFARLE